jgi:hypothetical protein
MRGHTDTTAPEGTWSGRELCHWLRAVERPALGGQLPTREVRPHPHFAIAVRATPSGAFASAGRRSCVGLRRCGKKLSGESQQDGTSGVREESELPDSDEASRQNVLGKAAEELRRFQSHLLLLVAMRVVFPAEGDMLSVESE